MALTDEGKAWKHIELGALKALTTIKFSTEDSKLYPPLCKQHIWQRVLLQAVVKAAKLIQDSPTLTLMHGLLPYKPMEVVSFHTDAAYKSTQFSKEELTFLRKLRLEQFLCDVPWGVVHSARALEAINTLHTNTLQVTIKGEELPLFSANWRELFFKVFHLTPKAAGEGGKLQLQDLFPSLTTIQEGQKSVKVGDCQVAGSKRPLRLLSSFFCLNTSGQYSISIHFANLVLAALNGEKVDWPLEFFDEFKAEVLTLHQHQEEEKAKVMKTAIGPHLTIIIDEANLLDNQERRVAGYGTPAGLSMTEREPPPRKRKLGDPTGKGKLDAVIRVTSRYPHPSKNQAQAVRDAETTGEPSKRRVIQAVEKWQVPNDTSTMVNHICFAHRRLEQLLTTLTSKAGPEFVKRMDAEFHELQTEATNHYNQSLRLKEPLTTKEQEVEKGLLHIEIGKLKKELATLNENYDEQIEVSFELQNQLTIADETLATLTVAKRTQQANFDQMKEDLSQRTQQLETTEAELESTQHQFSTLQIQHQEQTTILATTMEELNQYRMTSHYPSPDTPRSGNRTPYESDSNAQANTSGLYSLVEEASHLPELQGLTIQELQRELAYIKRERDDLQVTIERVMESPHQAEEETWDSTNISRASILPKTVVYQQLTANISPFTTIMQCYHALKGLNLLTSRVPLLKSGTSLSKTQFERIWDMADATARDTLAFMWVTGEIKMPSGIMELVT